MTRIRNNIALNRKYFYGFFNSKGEPFGFPLSMKMNDEVCGGYYRIADKFAHFFSSYAPNTNSTTLSLIYFRFYCVKVPYISVDIVYNLFNALKNSLPYNPNNISAQCT